MIDFPKFGHINNMRYGQFSYIHYQLTAPANETWNIDSSTMISDLMQIMSSTPISYREQIIYAWNFVHSTILLTIPGKARNYYSFS